MDVRFWVCGQGILVVWTLYFGCMNVVFWLYGRFIWLCGRCTVGF